MNVETEPRTYCYGRGVAGRGWGMRWQNIFWWWDSNFFLRREVTKSFEAWVVKDFWKVTAK